MAHQQSCGAVLQDVASRLTSSVARLGDTAESLASHRDAISSACARALSHFAGSAQSPIAPTPEEFGQFLASVHDLHVRSDTAVRSTLLRVIRHALQNKALFEVLVQQDWHYLICLSLERDSGQAETRERDQDYYISERTQALKCMKKCFDVAMIKGQPPNQEQQQQQQQLQQDPGSRNSFLALAQSLVAVASQKGDSLRRVCLDTLRELSIVNTKLVAVVNGFTVLMEAIFDPLNSDLNEPIILSFLYVLNDPRTRKYIRPHQDLRTLISPFTDLEYLDPTVSAATAAGTPTSTESIYALKAAKAALVTIMRSWVGVMQLSSDELGLPTLVHMLRDTKVSSSIHNAI